MKEKPLSDTTIWMMRGAAILFDIFSLVTLIPGIGWGLGWIVWLVAYATFWLWFLLNGRNIFGLTNPMRLFGSLGAGIVEFAPEFGALPAWSILIWWLTSGEKMVAKVIDHVPGGENVAKVVTKKTE